MDDLEIEKPNSENGDADIEQPEEETVESLKTKNAQLFERAKKAEGFEKDGEGKWVKKLKTESVKVEVKTESTLTAKDALLLNEHGVKSNQVETVEKFAKFNGITVSEALKDSTLKAILATKTEEETSAAATAIKSPRGSSKPTPESIIEKARKGQLGENDTEALAEARMALRKNKNKS